MLLTYPMIALRITFAQQDILHQCVKFQGGWRPALGTYAHTVPLIANALQSMHSAMPCDEGYKKLCCLLSAKRIHQSGLSIDSENLISEDRVIDELVSDDLGAS